MNAETEIRIIFPYLGIGLQPIAPGIISDNFFGSMHSDGPFFQNNISFLICYIDVVDIFSRHFPSPFMESRVSPMGRICRYAVHMAK
jgi:hypothetical protein